ncbi:MAG: hypothetical protein Q4C75_03875, partial [Bergeyella zoohelcum]|nr:hypothetical protein [Bergeyella zoohelcum]
MKKIFTALSFVGVLWASQTKAQIVLEALDGGVSIPPTNPIAIPNGITLGNSMRFFSSIYDE